MAFLSNLSPSIATVFYLDYSPICIFGMSIFLVCSFAFDFHFFCVSNFLVSHFIDSILVPIS